jgi:hypothetical protein
MDLSDNYLKIENNLCKMYCKFGFCSNNERKSCSKLHNTNLILNIEIIKAKAKMNNNKKKRELKVVEAENDVVNKKNIKLDDEQVNNEVLESSLVERFDLGSCNYAHTSGIDAFMTGYSFVYFLQKFSSLVEIMNDSDDNFIKLCDLSLTNWLNNVYLSGKDYPLIINKSNFVTTSTNHKEKMSKMHQN